VFMLASTGWFRSSSTGAYLCTARVPAVPRSAPLRRPIRLAADPMLQASRAIDTILVTEAVREFGYRP
jgi:hypothetical protein